MADQETLNLDLTKEGAASLYLLLETALDVLEFKKSTLKEIASLPLEERPKEFKEDPKIISEVINLNNVLRSDGRIIMKEVKQIIFELEKAKGPLIIPKPNFRAQD